MRPLPQDEFALEMRTHFLETTLLALDAIQAESSFQSRFMDLCAEWEVEAKGNDMPFLAALLERLRTEVQSGENKFTPQHICEKLKAYLQLLRTSGDCEDASGEVTNLVTSKQEEDVKTFLQCHRGGMRFLLAVDNVVEISQFRKINPLPRAEGRVKGLIGFRGQGTPVFDLEFAGFPAADEKSFFVICEHEKSFFAVEVNGTDDILKIKPSEFQPSIAGTNTQFTTKDDHILLLLDIPKLVAS